MNTTLTLSYWIYALLLACLAVCWADVLVRPGMLLAPVQAWVKAWYRNATWGAYPMPENPNWTERRSKELDDQWWWQPLWGCYKCCSGQFAFWGYLLLFTRLQWAHHLPYLAGYHLLAHLGFAAITTILSIIVQKWSQ